MTSRAFDSGQFWGSAVETQDKLRLKPAAPAPHLGISSSSSCSTYSPSPCSCAWDSSGYGPRPWIPALIWGTERSIWLLALSWLAWIILVIWGWEMSLPLSFFLSLALTFKTLSVPLLYCCCVDTLHSVL